MLDRSAVLRPKHSCACMTVMFFCKCLLKILNPTWEEVGILSANPDNKTFFFNMDHYFSLKYISLSFSFLIHQKEVEIRPKNIRIISILMLHLLVFVKF